MSETRVVTNEDLEKYYPLVEKYLRDYVKKNWNEAQLNPAQGDVSLGNTGITMNDIRQHLRTEVVVALQKFDPNYITKEGRTVKELTFVYQHLFNRCGQFMKKLTKKRYGYGVWTNNLEEVLWETDRD
jgi:hypothetical protein